MLSTQMTLHYIMYGFTVLDEELPDYIMVMVANKKTSQQMADDLSLFLGNNTLKFTTWYDQNNVLLVLLTFTLLLFSPREYLEYA